jgi:hypothetical protein
VKRREKVYIAERGRQLRGSAISAHKRDEWRGEDASGLNEYEQVHSHTWG